MALPGVLKTPEEEEAERQAQALGLAAPTTPDTLYAVDPAGGGGGAAPAAPAAPAVPTSIFPPEQSKTVTTTRGASTDTTSVKTSPEMKAALGEATEATNNLRDATQEKALADERLQTAQVLADQKKIQGEVQAEQARQKAQADALAERDRQIAAANDTIAAARAKVDQDFAASQQDYFSSKGPAGTLAEILAGIAVAAEKRNLRIMGADPNSGGVQQTVNRLVENHKNATLRQYLKSKEYLEEAKALPGGAREAYSRKLADIQATTSQQLVLLAKQAEALKNSAQLDSGAISASQQALVAKAAEEAGKAQVELMTPFQDKVTRHGGSVDTQRTDVDASAAPKPVPLASPADIDTKSKAEGAAKSLEELADLVEKNPKSWEAYQAAANRQSREESYKDVPVLKYTVRPAQAIDNALGIGGPTVEAKLASAKDSAGTEIARRVDQAATLIAKGNDPTSAVTAADLELAYRQMGTGSQDPKGFAKYLRDRAKAEREKARAYGASREYR